MWKEYKVGHLADITSAKRIFYSEYVPNGVPFFRSKEVIDKYNKREVVTELFITEERFADIKGKFGVPVADDILLTSVGTLGIPYLVKENDRFYFKDGNLTWFRNFEKSQINVQYFFIWLQSKIGKSKLDEITIGSTQPALTISGLKEIEILLPSLPEQLRISETLSSLDDKIDLLHRQNKTLEALAETLFRQWFVEEAEESWEEGLLGEFISIKHGYAFKGVYISSEPTNLILVTPGNFKIGGGFKFDKFKYYTSKEFPNNYIFKTGDLIVTMTDLSVDGDTLGSPALIPENYLNELYLHNQRVGKVEFKIEIGKNFIYYLLKTKEYQWFILGGASGTAIRHTSPTSICSFAFRIPTKEKILAFENFANDLEEKNKRNETQIKTLTRLRDTLLPKLMSGEVRVEN